MAAPVNEAHEPELPMGCGASALGMRVEVHRHARTTSCKKG